MCGRISRKRSKTSDLKLPADRVFLEEDQDHSATLRAVCHAYALQGEENICPHCRQAERAQKIKAQLYYLV